MTNLCIFTANADELLVASAARVGITIASYECNPWKGYVSGKLKAGVDFLNTRTEPFVMWVDGTDALILKPADEIIARLQVYGFQTIIASEATCWPDADRAGKYPERMAPPRFLNAGGFIGVRGEVMTAMHTAIKCADNEDDQRAWTTAYLDGLLNNFQIDHARRLFCSQGDGDTDGADPCSRHWNGRIGGRVEFWESIVAGREAIR